jgi:hypothetical protein
MRHETGLACLHRQLGGGTPPAGTLTVPLQPQKVLLPLIVTFVTAPHGQLREIWIEHPRDNDDDL